MSDFKDIDRLLESFLRLEKAPVGCALSISRGEETIYEKYFAVFRQFSMTKVVFMQQAYPNLEEYCHFRLRAAVNGLFR